MATSPRNPERPFNATTCAQAMERLREAESGSSLVSDRKNRELLEQAREQVRKLCPDGEENGKSK